MFFSYADQEQFLRQGRLTAARRNQSRVFLRTCRQGLRL